MKIGQHFLDILYLSTLALDISFPKFTRSNRRGR